MKTSSSGKQDSGPYKSVEISPEISLKMKKLLAFSLLTLAQADPVEQHSGGQSRIARRSGCTKKIEDSTASCDDGDLKIELPPWKKVTKGCS